MALFSWTPALATGNKFIDEDHHTLIDRVNTVLEAISQGRSGSILSGTLAELVTYTREHFAREEAEMVRIQFADMQAHVVEHARLIKQVDDLKAKLDVGEKIDAMGLYTFLTRWVKGHIQQVDMKLAIALKDAA